MMYPLVAPQEARGLAPGARAGSPATYTMVKEAADPGLSIGGVIARRWKWFLFSAVVAAAVAGYVAYNFSQQAWRYEAALLYSKSMAASPDYMSPELDALAETITGHKVVDALRQEFGGQLSRRRFVNALESKVPYGTSVLKVSLTWDNAEQCEMMLGRILALFRAEVAGLQKAELDECLADYRIRLDRNKADLTAAKGALMDFNVQHGVVDTEEHLKRLQESIGVLDNNLIVAQADAHNCQAQLQRLVAAKPGDRLAQEAAAAANADLSATAKNLASGGANLAADSTTVTPANKLLPPPLLARADLDKRTFLRDLIRNQEDTVANETRLSLLEKEYSRAKALVEKQYISRAEYEKIEAQYRAEAALHDNRDVQKWRQEVRRIEERMPDLLLDNLRYGAAGPGDISQLATQVELRLVAAQGLVKQLEETLAAKRAEVERFRKVRQEAQDLVETVSAATTERERLEARQAAIQQLASSNLDPFTVIEPINLALDGVSSNARKLFALAFLAVGLVLTGPVFLSEALAAREPPIQIASRRLGLPVLARNAVPSCNRPAIDDNHRMLALRIQQATGPEGSVILFSSMCRNTPLPQLLDRLCECFSRRKETVVVVDLSHEHQHSAAVVNLLSIPEPEPVSRRRSRKGRTEVEIPGVSEYLLNGQAGIEGYVQHSRLEGIDYLLCGNRPMPAEALATKALTDLFQKLRERYHLVLVAGPTTARPVDLELLAARSDGIVLVNCGTRGQLPGTEEVVSNLVELKAPILGIVG